MSLESTYQRQRKYIVEIQCGDFHSGNDAMRFAGTLEARIAMKIGFKVEMRPPQIAGRAAGPVAVTRDFAGKTVLKTIFVELIGQDVAKAIIQEAEATLQDWNETHGDSVQIESTGMRGKPTPQRINMGG